MKMKVPINVGGASGLIETDGDKLTLSMTLENKKQVSLEIDDMKAVMQKLQQLTGRAAWEIKAVADELLQRLMADAIDRGIASVVITVATLEEVLRRIFPEVIAQPAGAKK